MDHDYRPPPAVIRQAQAARLATDLILECERAASRRNPRDCDPARWSKTAWRRYLYAAAHAPSLMDLERLYGLDCRAAPTANRAHVIQCLTSRGQRSPLYALKARRNPESSSGFLFAASDRSVPNSNSRVESKHDPAISTPP